ncbi:MAG: type I secretion system permease/ATPase [Pseudomonadota bacterium]
MNIPESEHPLDIALNAAKPALTAVAFFSLCINLLMLTSPLYMLQVYDRVLVSRSVDTLILLSIVALGALATYGLLEVVRARVLVRVGTRFDRALSDTVFASAMQKGAGAQPFRDLERIREFITGRSLAALFDIPWTPIYIALVYLLHPLLGHVALFGALVLLAIVFFNESSTRLPSNSAAGEMAAANQFIDAGSRNRDTIQSMGMLPGLSKVWHRWHDSGLAYQALANDRGGVVNGASKFVRVAIQSAILGVGAFLAINEVTSAGVMIAASIITGRALAPVETALGGWRSFLQAREARSRLHEHLAAGNPDDEPMQLPAPSGRVVFDNVFATVPGTRRPVLSGVSFQIESGTSVGLSGPSAAGKSSLARLMVGVWQPVSGEVRLDGAELTQWSPERLGPHIGYLAQDVELFPGTVAQNIARFGEIDAETVYEAAKLAGAHETIIQLEEGYETVLSSGGKNLSGGQRQRIGLARAFYGSPSLIVLDEPTSNLDGNGEAAVRAAVSTLKALGKTVVVIAHRPSLVSGVDKLLVIQKGKLTHFGPTDEVMPQIVRRPVAYSARTDASA